MQLPTKLEACMPHLQFDLNFNPVPGDHRNADGRSHAGE
jgi:hypothetical protein